MIGISKLYCGAVEASDSLRYVDRGRALRAGGATGPVVVWNCTRRCNLRCVHCYSASDSAVAEDELSTAEARAMIDDLASFGTAVLLLSGGEPLLRDDVLDLIAYARDRRLRVVLSTNGTVITPALAGRLGRAGVGYVGISLDGATAAVNDRFRGEQGAFERALAGIDNCRSAGLKVGLRFTINRRNFHEVAAIFDLVEGRDIPRVCFYHLVPSGRGGNLGDALLDADKTRRVVELILTRTRRLHQAGRAVQVLTVGNHADGPLVYLRLLREDPARAEEAWRLLRLNGGNSSGVGIGCVSWDGSVYPDQFWRARAVGNIRRRPFSEIWTDRQVALLSKLRDRHAHLLGRCSRCRFLEVCNGNLRARAAAAGNGAWGDDPACYLSNDEIKKNDD